MYFHSAVGSTLHLKSRYCHGYRLNVSTDAWKIQQVIARIPEVCPEAKLSYGSGSSLFFNIHCKSLASCPKLFHVLQHEKMFDGSKAVADWSISKATLEDCFLEVVGGG